MLFTVLHALAGFAFAMCWLLPGHYWPWKASQQEAMAAIGALLIGAVVIGRCKTISWPPIARLALACAAIPLIQWQFGLVRFAQDAVLAATYVAGFALCIAAGASATRERTVDLMSTLLWPLLFGACASAVLALLQWHDLEFSYFIDQTPHGGRTWANLGQPNNLATALAIGICVTLLAKSRGAFSGLTTAVILLLLGLGLVSTQSRTGYTFALLLTIGMLLAGRRMNIGVKPTSIAIGLAAFVAVVMIWPILFAAMNLNPAQAGSALDRVTTGAYRLIHWQVLIDALMQKPLTGYGWTQVALAQHAAMAAFPATGEVLANSHNIVLDLLIWNGVPIGLLLVVLLTAWYARQVRACDSAEKFYLLAVVFAMTLHAMLELPLEYAYFLLPLGFVVGALEGQDRPPAQAQKVAKPVFIAAWAAVLAITTWIIVEYIEVESTSRVLRFVAMGIGTDKVSHAPEPDVVLLDRQKQLHRFMLTPARKDPDPAYMAWVRFMSERHSTPPAMLRYALAAGINGHPDEAASALVRLCKLFGARSCDQGRDSWTGLQRRYPELTDVAYPAKDQP